MGLTINANGFDKLNAAGRTADGAVQQKEKKNVFGGNLNLLNDPVAQRRKEAQEKAWNVVKNAWDNDKSVDDAVQARRDDYARYAKLKKEAQDMLADHNESKEVLKTLYDVPDDSQEQQDLELLEKEQDALKGVGEQLTPEESERVMKIKEKPLTEYQQCVLELNDQAGELKKLIREYERGMTDSTGDIGQIKLERLKSNPMLDAKKASEQILEAANEEILGMLVQEAQEHIDEKMEEAEEKAEETAEQKEEREEEIDEMKLKRAVQEALIEGTKEAVEKAKAIERENESTELEIDEIMDITKVSGDMTKDVGQSLSDIKSNMKVLEADLKGIKVDQEV